ncbi:hypothetical protein GGS23DRAFT_188536 [Durotheca rogersii]|uniref:uncharacterized protein n=1 Tax=Durotheca rogersii TaxID=419775 RepID=UPI00221F45AD|nr:uncharacterized protein GGS23DRAFT_188536 [Durotheca rogersii]KAI5867674.1 hypothetical protein GGS23DRAFT_188536 [Durotheca rogersii]
MRSLPCRPCLVARRRRISSTAVPPAKSMVRRSNLLVLGQLTLRGSDHQRLASRERPSGAKTSGGSGPWRLRMRNTASCRQRCLPRSSSPPLPIDPRPYTATDGAGGWRLALPRRARCGAGSIRMPAGMQLYLSAWLPYLPLRAPRRQAGGSRGFAATSMHISSKDSLGVGAMLVSPDEAACHNGSHPRYQTAVRRDRSFPRQACVQHTPRPKGYRHVAYFAGFS